MPAVDPPGSPVREGGGVEGGVAGGAGETGEVVEAGPGHHSLRLVDRHLAPHAPLQLLGDRAPAVVQVVVGLTNKKYFLVTSFTEYFLKRFYVMIFT